MQMKNPVLPKGEVITVFTKERVELGDGTFLRSEYIAEMNTTVYQCKEHTILAKGDHYVRSAGQMILVTV